MKKRAYPRVYRSYRPLKILLKILLCLVIVFVVGTVVLFFALRRYIRYTPDGTLYLEIPWLGYNVSEPPGGEAAPEGGVPEEPDTENAPESRDTGAENTPVGGASAAENAPEGGDTAAENSPAGVQAGE